ncbi:hypothetical protein D3C81_694800 [compost metagenome]
MKFARDIPFEPESARIAILLNDDVFSDHIDLLLQSAEISTLPGFDRILQDVNERLGHRDRILVSSGMGQINDSIQRIVYKMRVNFGQ